MSLTTVTQKLKDDNLKIAKSGNTPPSKFKEKGNQSQLVNNNGNNKEKWKVKKISKMHHKINVSSKLQTKATHTQRALTRRITNSFIHNEMWTVHTPDYYKMVKTVKVRIARNNTQQ